MSNFLKGGIILCAPGWQRNLMRHRLSDDNIIGRAIRSRYYRVTTGGQWWREHFKSLKRENCIFCVEFLSFLLLLD